MVLNIIFFLLGTILVIKGADFLTDGASDIAKKYKVSTMIIGLTIVAFGTSMPEFVVSTIASIRHNSDISIGNVVGSNIFNTLAIMGCTALMCPVVCKRGSLVYDIPFCILASTLLLFFIQDYSLYGTNIGPLEGLIFLVLFSGFILYTLKTAKNDPQNPQNSHNPHNPQNPQNSQNSQNPIWKAIALVLLGLGCLIGGGELLVNGATGIAKDCGVSDAVIALTLVAAGTSFPELATSMVAAKKGDIDMALGNVVGSNIFNILLILGVASVINPLQIGSITNIDMIAMFGSAILLLLFAWIGKEKTITRTEGGLFVLCMILYYVWLVYNS